MDLRVHLKICEGCGCLWYRSQVEIRVYCTACYERFKEFPTPESRKRRGRPKKTFLPAVFAVQSAAQTRNGSLREELEGSYLEEVEKEELEEVDQEFREYRGNAGERGEMTAFLPGISDASRDACLSGGLR